MLSFPKEMSNINVTHFLSRYFPSKTIPGDVLLSLSNRGSILLDSTAFLAAITRNRFERMNPNLKRIEFALVVARANSMNAASSSSDTLARSLLCLVATRLQRQSPFEPINSRLR